MPTIMSGIEKIDTITGGFLPGELVFLCGREEMGKTTLLGRIALNIAQKAVRDKNPEFVLYFRQTGGIRVGMPRFRGIRNLQDEVIIDAYQPVLKIEDIVKNVQFQKKKRRLSVVAIDYLQLIGTKKPVDTDIYRKESANAVVSRLKQLAVEENICILLIARDYCRNHITTLKDLTKIGIVEPLADVVIFLHRPHHFTGFFSEIYLGPTTVTIAKNLHGGIGTCELGIKEFGEPPNMFSWHWDESNILQSTTDVKNSKHRDNGDIFFGNRMMGYHHLRNHLRWLFFGSPNRDEGKKPDDTTNGYVINGLRMDDKGFARLNESLRWPLAYDDQILDYDNSARFLEFEQSHIPEQYNAICPLDGYVTAINAESYWRLPPGEHTAVDGPDLVYRLCPHCLMELASRMRIRRCIRSID